MPLMAAMSVFFLVRFLGGAAGEGGVGCVGLWVCIDLGTEERIGEETW